jgi:uncharacterized protein YlxW (UPF0749 family)
MIINYDLIDRVNELWPAAPIAVAINDIRIHASSTIHFGY